LQKINVSQAETYIEKGYFLSEKMSITIMAAVNFIKNDPNREVIITSIIGLLDSKKGTIIVN
jgi:carbamate kinase